MGVIAEIINKIPQCCDCNVKDRCSKTFNRGCQKEFEAEAEIIAEIEKCVPEQIEWSPEAEYDFKDKYQLAKYNQAISEILSNIKKLKEGNSE
jgi:hypothetical protein